MGMLRLITPMAWALTVPLLAPAAVAQAAPPALLAGRVLGATAASPATVVLVAWPSQKTLNALRVHDAVPVLELARTRTDAAGGFVVPAAVADGVPGSHRGADGRLDLQLRAATPAASTVWSTTVVPTAAGWTSADVSVGTAARTGVVLSLSAGDAERSAQRALGAPAGPGGGAVTNACQVINLGRAGPTWAAIANVWGNPRTAYGRVTYTRSSSHTLGTAVSVTGQVGEFTSSGSMTRTAGIGFDTDYTVINRQIQGAWWYQKYLWNCIGYSEYELRPAEFYTGPRSISAGTRTLPYACSTYQAGWEFHRDSGANHAFSTGVNVGGVGVLSQVGWTSATSVSYKFGRPGKMCASQPSGLFLADFVGSA